MKKVPICVLLPEHFSSNQGGAEYQAGLLTDALCKTGKYEVYYVCQRAGGRFLHNDYRIHVVGKQWSRSSLFSFLAAKEIYAELKKIKPSIIYQKVGGVLTGVAGYYAKQHRIKFIWHVASDNDITLQWKSNWKSRIRTIPERLFLNYGIKYSSIIAPQTLYQSYLLKSKFGIDCHAYIPIGHPYPDDIVVKSPLITVLWIANLKPLKRPELFVRLAQKFHNRDNVRFIMIGRKGWGGWFEQLKRDIVHLPNFNYVGELTQEQVNQNLSHGHILVNTSRYEGFPNTFVQAWMRKVPVVSLTVDPDHILSREKIGFKSGTFEQLCLDVEALISDTNLRIQMGERACRYAFINHSVEKMLSNALEIIGR